MATASRPGVRRVGDRVQIAVDEVQSFLASDAGRTFRRMLAGGLILAAPLLFRVPVLKKYPLLRTLEMVGGAALVVKFAEAIRDWDPGQPHPVVVEIPRGDARGDR